ncbi:MAG: ATP-binding cassette domain-containing protein [Candidatus Izemoplasmataceae bacterium]
MLKLNALNKFYNRKKRNELHVLNDVTLEFPSKGLVILLGASGSGKTTLLNVMGGMDSFYKGTIEFEEAIINKYSPSVWDNLRNEKIGMIFQNYYLLPHLSVYENIALTLRMIGIKDEQEIENRIYYLLKAVNMFNYRKRLASQLSGGQQQRVAIVRALAKNPKLILADEPTGNLDSKNTLDIMRIIKQISKTGLVVMVTHERELAHYFADRIIELEDGKIIKDYDNVSSGSLSVNEETNIFLKDLEEKTLNKDQSEVKIYHDQGLESGFNARLIIKNKTLYIDLEKSMDVKKIVVLDEKSEIKLIEASSESVQEESDVEPFDFHEVLNKSVEKGKKRFNFSFKNVIAQSVSKILDASRGSKVLFFGFAIGAMIVASAVSNIFNIITVDDEDFLVQPKNTVDITYTKEEDYDDFLALMDHASIDDYSLYHSVNNPGVSLNLSLPNVYGRYQNYTSASITGNLVPLSQTSEEALLYGDFPSSADEVLLDIAFIHSLLNDKEEIRALDIKDPEDFLKLDIYLPSNALRDYPIKIVGITDTQAPVIYAYDAFIIQANELNYHPREFFDDDLTILAGRDITENDEILLSSLIVNPSSFAEETIIIQGKTFTVVGVYEGEMDGEDYFSSSILFSEAINTLYYESLTGQIQSAYVYSNNPDETVDYINGIETSTHQAQHIYRIERERYLADSLSRSIGSLIFSAVSLAATAISFYFVMRSSMISRIYEIGVYRALGTKRFELIKRFIVESAVLTTFSSLIGFIFMTYMIYTTNQSTESFYEIGHISVLSVMSGILFIYLVNIISGTLPVALLLRKTPAQIATSYDI